MPILVAAVVVLGAVTVLNLLLTIGIVRRLRANASAAGRSTPFALRAGAAIGEGEVMDTTGEPVRAGGLSGAVAFLSADCAACHDQLPGLVDYARREGRDQVLVVVAGGD